MDGRVHAAQKLGRQWIGIDIMHLAVSLIEKRLKDAETPKAFHLSAQGWRDEGAPTLGSQPPASQP